MPVISNPLAGSEAIASGEVIFQSHICVESDGNTLFSAGYAPELRAVLQTTNLPNLQWYLYLAHSYFEPGVGLHNAQLNITWQALHSVRRSIDFSVPAGQSTSLPFSAPALLPVGTPVRVNVRAPVTDIAFRLNVPVQSFPAPTISLIHFLLCASQ